MQCPRMAALVCTALLASSVAISSLSAAAQTYDDDDTNSTAAAVGGCQEVLVPMCRGLVDYTHARLPNRFNHTTQRDVYWALQPWWPFMDLGCSDNLRNFLCATYLPRCTPKGGDSNEAHVQQQDEDMEGQPPCQGTCRKAKQRCSGLTQRQGMRWGEELDCEDLPNFKQSKACVKQKRETHKKRWRRQMECQPNPMPMCQHLPYTLGSLPNPFMQSDLEEIRQEVRQYELLIESGCSTRLTFLLCGAFMPFCIHGPSLNEPYVVPCREVCQEVRNDCRRQFQKLWGGLPWPAKLHCHRYPSQRSKFVKKDKKSDKRAAPCAMPPVGF